MKHLRHIIFPFLLLGTSANAAVVASANFEGSAISTLTGGSVTTSATELNNGSSGGTWSALSASGANSAVAVQTGKILRFGDNPGANGTQTSTATFTLNSAATLDGAKISFDYAQLGAGGQPGNIFFDVFNGSNHVLRISGSPDAGGGRRTLSHWNSVGGTRTALSAEDQLGATSNTVTFTLASANFGVTVAGFPAVTGTNLAYITGGQTQFDRIVFTAVDSKSVAEIDNISIDAVPEPSALALLGLGGIALAGRRRK